MEKRGLSTVVGVMLLTVVALVTGGIAWVAVVQPALNSLDNTKAGGVPDCLQLSVSAVACYRNDTATVVSVQRGAETGAVDRLRFVFDNPSRKVLDIPLSFVPQTLETRLYTFNLSYVNQPSNVQVAGFVNGRLCQPSRTAIQCTDGIPANLQPSQPIVLLPDQLPPETLNQSNVTIEPLCNNGRDDDGDGWADSLDSDCTIGNGMEEWIALTECSDRIDNDGDGLTDEADNGCVDGRDYNERDNPDFDACADGIDNDNDGLIDFPLDSGCLGYNDEDESGSNDGPIQFTYALWNSSDVGNGFTAPGAFKQINWTGVSGRPVVWEDLARFYSVGANPYAYNASSQFYHQTWHGSWVVNVENPMTTSWTYTQGNSEIAVRYADMTYTVDDATADHVFVDVHVAAGGGDDVNVKDKFVFRGATIYHVVELTNLGSSTITVKNLPVFFPHLYLGDYGADGRFNSTNNQFVQYDGAELHHGINYSLSAYTALRPYPNAIGVYAPLGMLGDGQRFLVGAQALTPVYLPDSVSMGESIYTNTPYMRSYITSTIPAQETRRFVIAYKFTQGGSDWQNALQPYRDWFATTYGGGDTMPTYCPLGQLVGEVTTNNNRINYSTVRFLPNSQINSIIGPSALDILRNYSIEEFGLWATALNSGYLIVDDQLDDAPGGTIIGHANFSRFEFNPRIDLIDPNLDFATNRSKLTEFVNRNLQYGVKTYWFARPCADNSDANIIYNADGTTQFVKGHFAGVDLRNVTDRDRQFSYLRNLSLYGVSGFYFDATGCPGDEAFMQYVKNQLGPDTLILMEGSRDRTALNWPQIPLINFCSNGLCENFTAYPNLLVPLASYVGGAINGVLNATQGSAAGGTSEMDYFVDHGGTMFGGLFGSPQTDSCRWATKSYQNELSKWNAYGRTIPNCAQPTAPRC